MISRNSNFFYMYDTDESGSLKNVFWADSRAACKDFGDVISVDTTYVSNRYKMPFAPFIGVNNHGNAVAQVFPNARHRWCLWHIVRNANKHLNKHLKWDDVRNGLKNAPHDSLTIVEFEEAWQDWIKIFKLEKYNWCGDMHNVRHRWVLIYFKATFWASMSSTQRSKGMNFFFKGFLNINTTLKQFVEQFGFALAKRVKEEDN
uniref:Protein FAR1-RELATED SEQUENCE n=1 Tax=Chenopodium quinoa TaxID=63459 RepID=A0A803LYV3_CHEQI